MVRRSKRDHNGYGLDGKEGESEDGQLDKPKTKVFATLEEELGAAKEDYQNIAKAVESGLRLAIHHFRRLKLSKYTFDVHAQCLNRHEPPNKFIDKAISVQDKLKSLQVTIDENCASILAHRVFIMAVYEYPEYCHAIAFVLMYFLRDSTHRHRNMIVAEKLNEMMTAVLQKKTIYDEFLRPSSDEASTRRYEQLARDFPHLRKIRADTIFLKWKLAARHLNTATLMGYFVIIMNHRTYTEHLSTLIAHMTFNIDDENFVAVSRIFQITRSLVNYKTSILTNSICRMSRFLDKVPKNEDKYRKYKLMLKEIVLGQAQNDLIFRDKEKVMMQVGIKSANGNEQKKKLEQQVDNMREVLKPSRGHKRGQIPLFMKNLMVTSDKERREQGTEKSLPGIRDTNTTLKVFTGSSDFDFYQLFGGMMAGEVSGDCKIVEEVKKSFSRSQDQKETKSEDEQVSEDDENEENQEFVDALDVISDDEEYFEFNDPSEEEENGTGEDDSFLDDETEVGEGNPNPYDEEEDKIDYDNDEDGQQTFISTGPGLGDGDYVLEVLDPQELITEDAGDDDKTK